ncbi:MerR family transcriptional regulator [Paenibacillus nasutitermitis]|uniref:MerR family transcriptional regulator n=1 Tax=Paenibacillus nasutitermitis TaxID=1652958 RepID=A0A916ZBA4_9BACL|nr:MerR family transcriptional regulator [Paenibacillus nasutitermitis]GGD84133.1 MerR family transcriptional regulator [Paenibacillus nasutitermitis]
MKISELSKRTGASTRSIRHYEQKNLITAFRLENDYREFDESVVERIRTIQFYLGLGLTTDQIADVLECNDTGPEQYQFCDDVLKAYQEKSDTFARQIHSLEIVKRRLDEHIVQMTEMIEKQ